MEGLAEDTQLLQALARHSRLAPAAIAREAGLAATTVNRSFNGSATTRLSLPTLEKLRSAFPDYPGWAESRLAEPRSSFHGQDRNREPDLVEINEIDLRYGLGATYLDGPVASETRTFSRAWLKQFTHAPPERLFWTVGDGDSMEPTIRSGEVVLIDASQDTPRMAEGIWAVAMGEIGMIKRMHFPGKGRVELLSDNKLIPPIIVADDELHVVGRVVAVVRRL